MKWHGVTMPFHLIQFGLIRDNPVAENVIATCTIDALTNCSTGIRKTCDTKVMRFRCGSVVSTGRCTTLQALQSKPHLIRMRVGVYVRVVPPGYATSFIKNVGARCRDFHCLSRDLHTADENENECENEGYEFSCFHDDLPPVFSSVVVCGRVTYRGYMLELGRELLKPLDYPPIHSAIISG